MTFTNKKVINICTFYNINLLPFSVGKDFILGNSLFGVVKLPENTDPEKYKYFDHSSGFDVCASFSLSDVNGFGKNMIIFDEDIGLLVRIDNKKNMSWFLVKIQ